jgi:hypothetical protein
MLIINYSFDDNILFCFLKNAPLLLLLPWIICNLSFASISCDFEKNVERSKEVASIILNRPVIVKSFK